MQATDRADAPRKVEELSHVLNVAREIGIDIDCRNEAGQTPLHLAAKLGYLNKAALLLDHGADTAARDNRKKTPLMLARAAKRTEMVALLLSWQARQAAMRAIRSIAMPRAAGTSNGSVVG